MDLDRFWELVKAAVADDVDRRVQAERLTAMLEQLAPQEIASFDREVDPLWGTTNSSTEPGQLHFPTGCGWGFGACCPHSVAGAALPTVMAG